jgi:two-component system, NtrC family, sensor histidine kinase HydH
MNPTTGTGSTDEAVARAIEKNRREPQGRRATRAAAARMRWGWLAITAAMGIAVVVVSWSNYRGVLDAATMLDRGQALTLRLAVEQQLREGGGPEAEVAAIVAEQASEGLRFLAVYSEQGDLATRAGTPLGEVPQRIGRSEGGPRGSRTEEAAIAGGRIRIVSNSPRPPEGARRRGERERPAPLAFVMEFEPLTTQLTADARRTLLLSLVTALVLVTAGGVFWRMSQHREQVEHQLEHQRRLSAVGEMAAVLAHEIRNPLASLKGHAQLLAERLDAGAAERQKADRIVAEASRLEMLTTNLLDFARSAPLSRVPADPVAVLRAAADDAGPARIDIDTGGVVPRWSLDPDGMRQVLANVLRNALQASGNEDRVQAHVEAARDQLVYLVRDRGPGLPPGQESKIFEPFVTTRATGAGLGLSVALRLVRLHGGTITATNHPEGGAVFRITIPGD